MKLLTKEFKNKIIKYGKKYYNAKKTILKPNPDFEKCREKGFEDLRCNTCQYRRDCNKGEELWEDNENIIDELIEEIIRCIENRERKQDEQPTN